MTTRKKATTKRAPAKTAARKTTTTAAAKKEAAPAAQVDVASEATLSPAKQMAFGNPFESRRVWPD